MTSVEKRRSSRKSGGHRKHSDGGFSDTSSGGSFLDENDREVSNLTDRAFRSLCIGDEAVYNDSDLSLSSPSTQRDRQLAFTQSGQDRDIEDRGREELKRAAHENFSLRVQQYGQDWIHGGMYGAEIQRDPQWEVYGERTQGRVSATFQHSFAETSQQGKSLKDEELSFFSNGATDLSSQQRRSRSRVSSLIRAFDSEGQRDGAGMEEKFRDWNDETSWDKSALMSIQRELSEFSTSYQQYDSSNFPSVGPFSSRDTNYYSSEVAAMAHMSHSSASYMRSSHSQHSMSQVNCGSNFFIHSEFSPFKVWRDHNRFPYQQGEVSGFMHCSEFPKWYETPMYKELSIGSQPQSYFRGIRHPRNNLAPVATQTSSRSTSTSSVLQKASAVEKRCESELVGQFPHRTRTQSLGNHKLPSQRPSTASPTIEMSRRVRDTISSVKALQQKIKMMTEQNITAGVINQQGALYRHDHSIHLGNNALAVEPNVVSSNTSTTPFNIRQLLTPLVHAHQETEISALPQYEVSPQPVEHAPVRAESRGATPDVRMSSYKSRATSLLFNLKDNRKRVKSTYSPTKFKGLDTLEKSKPSSVQEPKETVIDIPNFSDPDKQFLQLEESRGTNAAINQNYSPGQSLTTHDSQPPRVNTGQYPENTATDYQTVQMQGQTVHHSGFSGFLPENYTSNQLANGQNPHEYLASFTPYKQSVIENVGTLGGLKQPYATMNTAKQNADNNQSRDYLISNTNTEQAFNETVGSVFTKVDRYEQLSVNKHDYNPSLQDKWRQANSQETEKLSVKAVVSPSKQETAPSMERSRKEKLPSRNKEPEKVELRETYSFGASSQNMTGLISSTNISNKLQGQYGQKENESKDGNQTYVDNEYRSKHELYSTTDTTQKTSQIKQYMPVLKASEMQSLPQIEAKPQIENDIQTNSLYNPDNVLSPTMTNQVKDRQLSDVKGKQLMAEHRKARHTQAEPAKAQQRVQVEQPAAESAGLILAEQTGSEKVKTEECKSELPKVESERQFKEHIKDEKRKREQTEKSREKQPEPAREEHTKAEAARVQKLTEKTSNIKEKEKEKKSHVLEMAEEQGKQVKVEQAETEKLEERIKTDLEKTELARPERMKQQKHDQATDKMITKDQVEEEQLNAERVEGEQMEAEQIRTGKVNAKQAGTECGKAEQRDEIRQAQSKTKHMKIKEDEVGEDKTENIKTEDARQVKDEKDSIRMVLVNADKPAAQISAANDATLEDRGAQLADKKLEKTKLEKTKAGLSKTENLLERSAKLTAKLAATQQVRSEPDKVEQVKTELAKAKAELAKIKEKMRGEQKERVKPNLVLKENDTSNDSVPLNTHLDKNKKQEQAAQIQTDRGAVEYDRLREKYGFTSPVLSRDRVSTTESDPLTDANETKVLPPDKVEEGNNKLKDGYSPTSTSMIGNKENKEEVSSIKDNEVTESSHGSSKELNLHSMSSVPTNSKRANEDNVANKLKNDSVEKCDSLKDAVSQQRNSDLARLNPTERKSKSTEHSAGSGKDLHVTPPRALSHKERAQTKQEILTSKIKAHAEKEISAIKEKGFALREGFIGKSSTKPFAGQNLSIRQRPPSEEMSNKRESTISSTLLLKHQKEPSGTPIEPAKLVSHNSSVKSAATTTQLADHLEQPRKGNQPVSSTMSTTEGLLIQRELGTKSPEQNKEQATKGNEGKQQGSHGEIFGKLQEELDNNQAIDGEISKRTEDPTQAIKAASSKPLTTEKAESNEAAHEDPTPLNTEIGQREASKVDNDLKIMGIMVTVRERKPSVNIDQGNNSLKKQIDAKDSSKPELNQWNPSSGLVENTSTNEASFVEDMNVQKTDSTIRAYQAKVDENNPPERAQDTSTIEATKNNMSGSETEKRTSLQQESSAVNAKPQSETQSKPITKDVPSTVTVYAKDKALAKTQAAVSKQDPETKENTNKTVKENLSKSSEQMKTDEDKNHQQIQTASINEDITAKVVNSGSQDNNNKAQTMKQNMAVKEDMTATRNNSRSSNIDDQRAPLLEEKRHDSAVLKPFNKASPSTAPAENENRHMSSKLKYNEKHSEKSNQDDDSIHIDCIAIRVVPAVTEKEIKTTVGKNDTTTLTSDLDFDKKHKLDVVSTCEEKAKSLNNEHCSKDLAPENSEQKMKESMEEKSTVQHVLSSATQPCDSNKMHSKQINRSATNNESDNQKQESSIQPGDGDYFQVQRITETHNGSQNNSTIVGDNVASTSKERELRELLPNKTAISNESCKEGKSEAFVFSVDQGDSKGDKPSPASSQDENRGKELETEALTLDSKLTGGPLERLTKNGNNDTSQPNHNRKNQTEALSSLSATDRQDSSNSHPTKANTAEEKSEPKLKSKEKVSTIPEISAIADYARLKVIVSDDKEVNPVQEFPPNKKEGFFPLIHTRHSRRPVLTADPQDISVKEKSLPNKTELSAKVNKEPKALVFPIMEKEHQRTGMFKLGDKEKQEKMPLDVKMNVDVLDNSVKHPDDKGPDKSPTAQTEEAAAADTQRVDQGVVQSDNHSLEAKTSFSVINKPKNMSEGFTYFVKNSPPHSTLGQMHDRKENTTQLRNDERTEMQQEQHTMAKTEGDRTEQLNNERLSTQHDDIKTKQQDKRKQLGEEQAFRSEKEQTEEKIRMNHITQGGSASLAEEEKKTTQREEERRTTERETVAIMINEKRENQRQVERRAEEGRTAVQSEEERLAQKPEVIQPTQPEKDIRNQRRAADEEQRKATQEKQQRNGVEMQKRNAEEQQRKVEEEQERRATQVEQQRWVAEERQRKAAEETQRRAAEETQRRAAEETQRRAVEETQRRAAEETQRRAVEEKQRRAVEEKQRRAVEEKQRAAEETQRRAAEEAQRRAAEEKQRRAAEETQRRAVEEKQRRAAEETQRRAAEEAQRRAAEEKQRRAVEEKQRRAVEEKQRRAAEEKQRAAEEKQRRAAEEKQRAAEEKQRRAAEEAQRRAAEETQRRAAEERQRRAAEETQRRAAEEAQRRAAEETQRRAAEETQRRASEEKQRAAEEKQRIAAEEAQRRAAEEKQRIAAEEAQRIAAEETQRRAAEERQRRAAEETQRRAAEEAQRRAAEEKQRIAAEEAQRRAAEETQRRAVEETQRRAAEEAQRRAAEETQRIAAEEAQRRAAEKAQRRAAEERQRRAAEEKQRRAAEEQQKQAVEEKQRRAAEEKQRTAGEQLRKGAQIEEKSQIKEIKDAMLTDVVEEKKRVHKEQDKSACISDGERIMQVQEHKQVKEHIEEQRRATYKPDITEKWTKTQNEEEEERGTAEREKIMKQVEEKEAKYESTGALEEKRIAQESIANRENEIQAKKKEEENLAAHREKARAAQIEKQKRAVQKMDGLQYYAITSTDTERKPKERQRSSPLPSHQRNSPLELESADESAYHPRPYRPPASPAPSLPRSNTSSPALGPKPSMFRVKDNTLRGSSLTKSVKPRFHKSFGEDFRVGSPFDKFSDRGEDEQEIMRRSTGTPVHPDLGSNRFGAIAESLTSLSTSSSHDYSTSISHHRPYSRRSIVMDEDESRSVISNMSEDAESYATSAADLADLRGLLDYDRPESACSFSSDVSRSMGKPPAVPPKSEKALRRAQRLTSRRIKKELSKAATGSSTGVEKEVSNGPSSSTEVCSSNRHAVASPHFSQPVSLAHAPTLDSSMPSSHAEHQPSTHRSFHASPHATGPISLPIPVPHATTSVSIPAVSPYASGLASQPATPKTVAHVSSSPTLHHANHPTPVTQYHVESSRYPQSYSLTQRKVLQDLGSGQYFVVDLPVQVKTKTFFDPETGKYVQLNVRESGQSISQPQPPPQTQAKLQPQPLSQASTAGKPLMFYQGYQSYPQSYQAATVSPVQPNKSSAPTTLHQEHLPPRTIEVEQNSEEHRYSPEKTPYMDTVNNVKKTYNQAGSTHESYECDTDSQLDGSSAFETDNTAPAQYQPRDIITMSEIEDFMEVSDW